MAHVTEHMASRLSLHPARWKSRQPHPRPRHCVVDDGGRRRMARCRQPLPHLGRTARSRAVHRTDLVVDLWPHQETDAPACFHHDSGHVPRRRRIPHHLSRPRPRARRRSLRRPGSTLERPRGIAADPDCVARAPRGDRRSLRAARRLRPTRRHVRTRSARRSRGGVDCGCAIHSARIQRRYHPVHLQSMRGSLDDFS